MLIPKASGRMSKNTEQRKQKRSWWALVVTNEPVDAMVQADYRSFYIK